jgi:hypothetical protein
MKPIFGSGKERKDWEASFGMGKSFDFGRGKQRVLCAAPHTTPPLSSLLYFLRIVVGKIKYFIRKSHKKWRKFHF